jgi:hypothetical protein
MNPIINFLNKNIKLSGNYGSLLQNRIVLYFFCFMAIIDVMYFATINDIRSLITLLIVGFLTTFFNKNMIIVLVIALTVTHVLKYGANVNEGMTNREGMKETIDAGLKEVADEEEKNVLEKEPTPKEKKAKIDKDALKESLKTDFKEFQGIQKDIIDGLQKIDPLLTRVEKFVEKYENYKAMGAESK